MLKKVLILIPTGLFFLGGCLAMMNLPGESAPADMDETAKTAPKTTVARGNLVDDPGFEEGTAGWAPFGDSLVVHSTDQAHSGQGSLFISERVADWQGSGIDLKDRCPKDYTYSVSAWVFPDNAEKAVIKISVKKADSTGTVYGSAVEVEVPGQTWTKLTGEYTVESPGEIIELTFYVEGPGPGVNYYIDDVEVKVVSD